MVPRPFRTQQMLTAVSGEMKGLTEAKVGLLVHLGVTMSLVPSLSGFRSPVAIVQQFSCPT